MFRVIFKTITFAAAKEAIGIRKQEARRPWISNATLEIVEKRREARLRGDMTEYKRLDSISNTAIRNDREKYWDNEATKLEEAARRNDQSLVYRLLRDARQAPTKKVSHIKSKQGDIITTEDACLKRWAEHFREHFQKPPHTSAITERDMTGLNDIPEPNSDCNCDTVTYSEVANALKKLKNNKAPGLCNITAEILNNGGHTMIEWLVQIINHVWVTEELPDDWRRGIILPFWKRKGDHLVCNNHRGITLLSVPGKLFTRILLQRALPAIRPSRRPQQAGSMPNRSTTDHISALRLIIEKHREFRKNRHLYIAFLDLRAAFDTIDRPTLWHILRSLAVPHKLLTMFQKLYDTAESCVRINGKESEMFPIDAGVRQGCVAAPDLFNCIIDQLMTKVCNRITGIHLGDFQLTDLDYADDTVIFCSTLAQLKDALVIFDQEATRLSLNGSTQVRGTLVPQPCLALSPGLTK